MVSQTARKATSAPPGSEEKIAVLAERLKKGHPLWHPGDVVRSERLAFLATVVGGHVVGRQLAEETAEGVKVVESHRAEPRRSWREIWPWVPADQKKFNALEAARKRALRAARRLERDRAARRDRALCRKAKLVWQAELGDGRVYRYETRTRREAIGRLKARLGLRPDQSLPPFTRWTLLPPLAA